MSSRLAPVLAVLAVVASVAAPVAAAPAAPAPAPAVPHLGLLDESFNVPADGGIQLTLQLPTPILTALTADSTLVVTAYARATDRNAVTAAIDSDLPSKVDSVSIRFDEVARPAIDQVHATVPIEIDRRNRTSAALLLDAPGVYPLLLEVQEKGAVLAELLTFVHRLPTADEPAETPLTVAMVMATHQPVVLDDNTNVVLDDATMAELTQLADVLEATSIPIAVRVPPALLAALPSAGPDGEALAQRLQGLLPHTELLSAPSLPLDPSLAAAAGQQALYTQWLRDGEDVLTRQGKTLTTRSIAIVDEPISQAGGALLRDLGARLLVLPVDWYDGLPDTLGGFTDTTQLVQVEVAPGVTVDATVVDRAIDNTLVRPTSTPVLTAILTTADLLAAREHIADGGDPARHGITLATPDLSVPPTETVRAITALIDTTPGLRPTTLKDLVGSTDQLLVDGTEAIVHPPEQVPGSIADRVATSDSLALEAASTLSMLPDGDPRPGTWTRLAGILPTSALTDQQVSTIAADLRGQYASIRNAVQLPAGFSFTLTGRKSVVPVKLHNTSDTPLKVRVLMSSPKLLFPDPPQVVTLQPNEYTEIKIPIEARSNGRFPVSLEVFTPAGDVMLGQPVPLTASVNAISGLGNLVTGALLLVLLTWWVRYVRENRRRRASENALQRHPATSPDAPPTTASPSGEAVASATAAYPLGEAGGGDDTATQDRVPIDDSGLSPDAATSTLPPS